MYAKIGSYPLTPTSPILNPRQVNPTATARSVYDDRIANPVLCRPHLMTTASPTSSYDDRIANLVLWRPHR